MLVGKKFLFLQGFESDTVGLCRFHRTKNEKMKNEKMKMKKMK